MAWPERVVAVPTTEAGRLRHTARRTAVLRIVLAVGLLFALAGGVVVARSEGVNRAPLVPSGKTGIVVLDLSASTSEAAFTQTIEKLASGDERVGVIAFSDTAYELLPIGTPGRELLPLLRYFSTEGGNEPPAQHPWVDFRAGTRVSEGMRLGRETLLREGVDNGSLILVSDFEILPERDPARRRAGGVRTGRRHRGVARAAPADARTEGADVLDLARRDPNGLLSAARAIADGKRPLSDEGALHLLSLLRRESGPAPGGAVAIRLLQARPGAVYDAARILVGYPELNGFYADGSAWHHETVAIGFAINLGKSLRVPVVRGAEELSQLEIARKVRDLSLRYMRGELAMDDVTGGTFTVTDLSAHGVVHFVPVLNEKQAAILGICAERQGTGQRDLVLTFDHRMSDGMRAAAFLGDLKASLEAVVAD